MFVFFFFNENTMLKNEHSITVRLHGANTHIYDTPKFSELIKVEVTEAVMSERTKLLKQLKPITDLFTKDWIGTICVTNDDSGYSEALGYNHITDVSAEISILMMHGQVPQLDIPLRLTDESEFVDELHQYLNENKDKHTQTLHSVYLKTIVGVLKHYGKRCKIKRSVNRLIHCFIITPTINSGLGISLQIVLIPRHRTNGIPSMNSIIQ